MLKYETKEMKKVAGKMEHQERRQRNKLGNEPKY